MGRPGPQSARRPTPQVLGASTGDYLSTWGARIMLVGMTNCGTCHGSGRVREYVATNRFDKKGHRIWEWQGVPCKSCGGSGKR
jgi:mono/diheme cytochrome c family protein